MAHRNARLNVFGRRLLVDRVRMQGWPVAHAARAMGISRQCAHRWVTRFDVEGLAGLEDRSSRPHRSPNRTSPEVEARVIRQRIVQRTQTPLAQNPHQGRMQNIIGIHIPRCHHSGKPAQLAVRRLDELNIVRFESHLVVEQTLKILNRFTNTDAERTPNAT